MPVDFRLYVGGRFHDVLFRHAQTEQDASMFLSTEYDFIGLEEIAPAYLPGEKKISPGISEGVFDMAFSRLTRQVARAEAIGPELAMTCNSPPLAHWASKRIIDKPENYLQSLNWAHWMFPVSDNAQNLRADYYTSLEAAWEGKRALIQRFIKGERIPVFVGIPRFNMDRLDELRKLAIQPGFRGHLIQTPNNPLHVKLEANREGWLRMWQPPAIGKRYVIGADVAEGIEGGDYSSAHVLDADDASIVAAYHGHLEPEQFGYELARLGNLYNTAKIGVESNNHGLTTLTALKNANYKAIFYYQSLDARSRRQQRMGFPTDSRTKPLIVNAIGQYLDEGAEPIDGDLISELSTFGVMENGECQAQEGCFDDRVISFGIGLVVRKFAGISRYFPSLAA